MAKGTASEKEMFEGARKFIVKHGGKLPENPTFEWNDYDWSLNKTK